MTDCGPTYSANLRRIAHCAILVWCVILMRLLYVQVWADEEYSELARKQQERRIELKAKRGRVFDRSGESLIINLRSLSFAADPHRVSRPGLVAATFSRVSQASPSSLRQKLREPRSFVWLARQVDYDRGERITKSGMGKAQGVYRFVEFKRCYPLGAFAGQLLGYTDIDNAGIEGCELAFEKHLGGKSGRALLKIDAKGHLLTDVEDIEEEMEDGRDVALTVSAVYQGIAEEELIRTVRQYRADSGCAIVMEPSTGEILALANVPVFDPNNPRRYPARTRKNHAIADLFEPGSTFKIVALAAALEERAVKPDDRIFCENGKMAIAGGRISDAHPHGWLTFREVVEQSSNIGTIKVARMLEPDKIYEYARKYGFGERTGIDLPGEINGKLSEPSEWSRRSRDTIVIGQEIGVTALQLANAYCAIANGGRLMVPHVRKALFDSDGDVDDETDPESIRWVMSGRTSKVLKDLLAGVVERGTGTNARIRGVEVAGKTGTAQRVDDGGHGYSKGRYVSSFVGFLPVDEPKLLCLVVIDSPRGGYYASEVAAPTFRRIMERILSAEGDKVERRIDDASDSTWTENDDGRVDVPNVKGMPRATAEAVLDETGLSVELDGKNEIVTSQSVEPGTRVELGSRVQLHCDEDPVDVKMPKLVGMSIKQAMNRLTEGGIRFRTVGFGTVRQQSPRPGARIGKGAVVTIKGENS